MPKLTPEQFAQIVRTAADARAKVKNVRIGDATVIVDIVSKSGKSAYQYVLKFNEVTGDYDVIGAFAASAKEPRFLGDAIRKAIKGITGA